MRIRAALGLLACLWGVAASAQVPAGERGFRGLVVLRGERVLAEDVLAEDVLAEENAEHRFTPASVMKLVVAAAALHHLGPEYRAVTSLHAASGAVFEDGALAGDLVVRAAGDPSWSRRFHPQNPGAPLEALTAELRARGLERVRGALVVDLSRFPGRPSPPTRALGEVAYGYAAPVSGLAIDENTIAIEIAPGRLGEPARLSGPQGLALENRTRTVGRERHGKGTIDLWPVWGEGRIVVTGEYPVSEPSYRIEASHPEPEARAALALLAALRERGIEVEGGVRLEYRPRSLGAELAAWRSPPLAELLEPVLEKSHNWLAEMLLRLLAAEVGGEGRLDAGLELERDFLENVVGIDAEAFELDDASGISPHNLLTPRAVAELLRWAWRQPWRGVWLEALATPGEGTLEVWPGLPPLWAKTGSGHQTVALAGYLGSNLVRNEAEPIVFVIFENRRLEPRPVQRREIAALLRRWATR